jgi:uncharacterized protein (TIGR02594 family)
MSQPNWLTEALKLKGVHEGTEGKPNPKVVALYADAGFPEDKDDSSIPWCAAFVGAILKRSGHKPSGSLLALSYEKWGQHLDHPALGAIATKKRFSKKTGKLIGGHVFFVVGWDEHNVYAFGGNEDDQVETESITLSQVTAYRWPSDVPLPGEKPKSLAVPPEFLPIAHSKSEA